jgi:hypothetical protein
MISEVRQYQYGDDIRNMIEWQTLQRSPRKSFEEERELTMMLMVDISGRKVLVLKANLKKILLPRLPPTMAFLQRRIMTK